jgi:uncharacterized protein
MPAVKYVLSYRALAVFRTREAAEEFAACDPFVVHGMVADWSIRAWNEVLLPESS